MTDWYPPGCKECTKVKICMIFDWYKYPVRRIHNAELDTDSGPWNEEIWNAIANSCKFREIGEQVGYSGSTLEDTGKNCERCSKREVCKPFAMLLDIYRSYMDTIYNMTTQHASASLLVNALANHCSQYTKEKKKRR